jgi:hypothetical protein
MWGGWRGEEEAGVREEDKKGRVKKEKEGG